MLWNGTDRQRDRNHLNGYSDCDDTSIDKGSEHTIQILAELVHMGQNIMRPLNLFILFREERKSLYSKTIDQHPYLTQTVTARV